MVSSSGERHSPNRGERFWVLSDGHSRPGESDSPKRVFEVQWCCFVETSSRRARSGEVVYACGVVFGLGGLSPIRVWDVLGGWTHDGHGTGTVMFPSATIGRRVHSMVIACVPGSKYETWMFYYRRGVGESDSPKRVFEVQWCCFVETSSRRGLCVVLGKGVTRPGERISPK
ncbi:hypothetical protein DEO72_LG8g1130 [Vigna unguiculata]|uniref:Uncharacterized protein n=1 Tax=Vigna unguiculata TaxID=3917 RepID=A0A4D6MSN7_VIGUN|nr:hypothetical protein DEO72_LG8g1130 [Vigna unguiculata]